ncbi:MAG: HEAT repeat domain-containing protein, partial [Gammaproteobacteria bacterium]|nr:HEAT repeat domain-containing protein [Gammaproteobacteria bacterium]
MLNQETQEKLKLSIRELSLKNISNRLSSLSFLSDLSWNNEISRVSIREEGGIVLLVELLHESDVDIIKYAVEILWNLAKNIENKVEIFHAGVVDLLIILLKHEDFQIRQYSSAAIGVLAENNAEHALKIGQTDALVGLVNLLRDQHGKVREKAIFALLSLSINDANKTNIGKLGALETLISLLNDEYRPVKESSIVLLTALITNNSTNQSALITEKTISHIISFFSDSNVKLVGFGLNFIKTLSVFSSAQDLMIKAGIINKLLLFFENN